MPTIDVWLTVVHGVKNTTAKDFHRSEKVFVHVPLKFKVRIFTWTGSDEGHSCTDGKLALSGTERSRS